LAKDSTHDQDGRPHIEHARDHGTFEGFPSKMIMGFFNIKEGGIKEDGSLRGLLEAYFGGN